MVEYSKPTIMIVDDMAVNIQILFDLLKDDYNIKIAKSGQKALEIARGVQKPDLILLDVVMPNMDGYEVCKILKNDPSTHNIPVIFVTGNDGTEDEEYGLNLGAVDYIKKPFHPTIVKIRVKNHINLKLKSDMLEDLSMHDGLTNIPNRRSFDEVYEQKYKEALRDGVSLAILMIDVDFFKPYNDNYGHGRGDEALVWVAKTIQNTIKRPSDFAARYGGEEFVVILKNTTYEGTKQVASLLLEAVRSLKIPHEYSKIERFLTISIGISYKNENENNISKEELLKRADEALYESKNRGKNCFSIG